MIRLALRVGRAQAEVVLAELLELAPGGVEEVELDTETIEYVVYGAPGELPGLPDLEALAAGERVQISTSEVADDWSERWREFHQPVSVPAPAVPIGGPDVPAIRVRPPWEPAEQHSADLLELVIDPGQAFGTGAHATTRLCLGLLLELRARGIQGALLDVGTGSGVLAIAASQLGFAPLLGLDNERESVEAAAENAVRNGVQLPVRHFELRSEPLPWLGERQAGPVAGVETIVLANLLAPLLRELARSIETLPGHLVASGLLDTELDEIAAVFAGLGMRELARRTDSGWGALWLAGP